MWYSEGEIIEEKIEFDSVSQLRLFLNSGKKYLKMRNCIWKINRIKKIKSFSMVVECEVISKRNWNLEQVLNDEDDKLHVVT